MLINMKFHHLFSFFFFLFDVKKEILAAASDFDELLISQYCGFISLFCCKMSKYVQIFSCQQMEIRADLMDAHMYAFKRFVFSIS